ncbi:MAG: hypothetical protein MJ222_04880 [Bacilli bacterium]|nr:hypothetical protein [Bacilli bacterium]
MKKAIKLLSLAMLFAMPLAACGNNDNGGNNGNNGGSESGDSGGGGGQHSGDEGGGSGSGGGGGQHSGDEGGGSGSGGGGGQQASTVVLDFSKIKDVSGKVGSVSYTTDIGSGQSAPAYNEAKQELRLYLSNTITFSGATFTSIEFDANGCGETKATGTLSASTGSLSGFKWSGNASSVKFTVNGGKQVHINSITIKTNGAGGGSGDEGGGGGQTSSDAESIMQLICLDLTGDDSLYEDDGEGGFETCLAGDEFDESELVGEVEYVLGLLPEDFYYYDEPAEDEDEYGLFAYGSAANDDGIFVEVYTYNDDGDGVYEIYVYPIEWED